MSVLRTVRETLMKWQRVSRLRFRYKPTGVADIMIKFVKREHDDQYAFDGPGGTLAHAFFPGRHSKCGGVFFNTLHTKLRYIPYGVNLPHKVILNC